jgi:hypothetical protein
LALTSFAFVSGIRKVTGYTTKVEGITFEDIVNEHRVSIMSVQRWIAAYIQSDIERVIKKKPVDQNQADITDEDICLVILEILGI